MNKRKKILLISQRIVINDYDMNCKLSLEWINLFNNFKDTCLIPIFPNSDLSYFFNYLNVVGIVISGGNDIYNKKTDIKSKKNEESLIRDTFEKNLVKISIQKNIPLLAVCRGCQLLCNLNGFKIVNNPGHVNTYHKINFINKTKYLNEFIKYSDLKVNSYHNQCIKFDSEIVSNLNIICTSEDDYIEAVEYKENKILGIMWHPERDLDIKNLNLISNFFNLNLIKYKVFVLCAGKGTRLRPLTDKKPKCMVKYKNVEIIDYILESLRINKLNDIILIKGYLSEKLNKKNTQNVINYEYNKTNMVYTLFQAIDHMDDESDIIISYSDIVYHPKIIQKLKESNDPISVVIDKDWYNLWSQRMENPLLDAETLKIDENGYIKEIGKKPKSYSEIEGQYIGLIKIKNNIVKDIIKLYKESNIDENIYMTDFLTLISEKICPLKAVFINGGWAEFDTIEDLSYNLDVLWYKKNKLNFASKAENLNNLIDKIQTATISKLYYFNYKDFKDNKQEIIKNIKNKFKNLKIIVRSSSMNEDNVLSSNAGQFLSINNIDANNDLEILDSIEKVFNSYGNIANNDQILIQESLNNIISCGVLFTFDCLTNSYYYTLTYDESGSSDSVTSGVNNNNQMCIYKVKKSKADIKNKYLKELIKLSNELEEIFLNDKLDIEFCFVKENNKLYLLQVRPLVINKKIKILENNELINFHNIIYNKLNTYLDKDYNDIYGDKSILSVMTDWNPAEIIGLKPKQLALSIYKEIITDNIAMLSRKECGYKDVTSYPLMITLINRPYIDVRISFSSLIPKRLNDSISNKLCNYYLNKLIENPFLHDKVEFDICFTCNTINLNKKIQILKNHNFSLSEINEINNQLIFLTNNIIDPKNNRIENEYDRLKILEKIQNKIIKSNKEDIDKIYELTQILKKYGTLPFSNLARFAFIGKSILLSLVDENIITNDRYNEFMLSIHTISKDMSNDINLYSKDIISKEDFLYKYGHLRPGTYDITSKRYDEDFDTYFSKDYLLNLKKSEKIENNKKFCLTFDEKNNINFFLKQSNFLSSINAETIFEFIKKSTESREYSKFIFSKTLSEILKVIKNILDNNYISLEAGSNLDFKIFNEIYSELKLKFIKDILVDNINRNENNYKINSKLNLPQLIVDKEEVYEFEYINSKPTFISNKKIQKEVIYIEGNNLDDKLCINDKIICVCNADPGWEWLFSRKIAGLITCYGGMNSHMAIRCQELMLPAVIGCGPEKFNIYNKCKTIVIDCELERIEIIN